MASPEASLTREQIRFRSGDSDCAAVLFRPGHDEPAACIVLGHGFGALREGGPAWCAERFAEAGYAGLAFDHRHFGESGGEPRQLADISHQLEDWRAAIEFARTLDGVDPDRIVLWGTSFAGGHVIAVAADDPGVAAVISQVPYADGIPTLLGFGAANIARLTVAAIADEAGALLDRPPVQIAIVGPPGTTAVMNTPDPAPGYEAVYDDEVSWDNRLAARVILRFPFWRPGRRAAEVRCPLLVQVAAEDALTPPAPAIEMAARAPRGELLTYAGLEHFDVYRGEAFETAVADQLEFLSRHV